MPPPSPLLDLLLRIGHVGELNRLLLVLREPGHPLGRRELIHLAHETSGWGHRYPRPDVAFAVAQCLGLIRPAGGQKFATSDFAESFILSTKASPIDLDDNQGKALLSVLRGDSEFDVVLRRVLLCMREQNTGRVTLPKRARWADGELTVIHVMQQIHCLTDAGDEFAVNPTFEAILFPDQRVLAALSESALWDRLEQQRLRARRIEELVVEFEKRRLVEQGRANLAEAVIRVSESNVSAGYDIASFEINGEPRLIEVKSSVSGLLQFHWSERERIVATNMGPAYWVYFVPFSAMCDPELRIVLLMQDPIKELKSGRIVEAPDSWKIDSKVAPMLSVFLPKATVIFSALGTKHSKGGVS